MWHRGLWLSNPKFLLTYLFILPHNVNQSFFFDSAGFSEPAAAAAAAADLDRVTLRPSPSPPAPPSPSDSAAAAFLDFICCRNSARLTEMSMLPAL